MCLSNILEENFVTLHCFIFFFLVEILSPKASIFFFFFFPIKETFKETWKIAQVLRANDNVFYMYIVKY